MKPTSVSTAMINEALATLDDITGWAPANTCTSLHMLRLDKLHPIVSGNKWYKLKHNAIQAKAEGKDTLLTFGGGHSNHLIATAYAAKEWGLKSIGIVRGHYTGEHFTPTLQACESYGMQLVPYTKEEYATAQTSAELAHQFPNAHIIPEGGANEAGIRGAADIAALIPSQTTDVCVAIGTGTTLAGIQSALPPGTRLHGFYVAKDIERTSSITSSLVRDRARNLTIHHVHHPRFGKWTPEAIQFIRDFHNSTAIPLDVVYTSKMMMMVQTLLHEDYFGSSARIVCIHTGGLQGNPSGLFSA